MRILYGVVGEGMGHAIRSRVILEHLVGRGHEVEIMVSGRAHGFLAKHFSDVNEIHGFHMISEDNRVRLGKTLFSNILRGIAGLPKNIMAYFELIDDFAPEVVISDFESWTYYYGKLHDLPIYSVDNMQLINRCQHAPEILEGARVEFELTRAFVKSKLPYCDHYLITSFATPPVRKKRTTLFPPILRREILDAERRGGDHVLVYQTGQGSESLSELLGSTGLECRVYGMRRDLTEDVTEGNVRHRPFSEAGFIEDLASARAVIASAGFTLMGEAVYLGKPMLTVPLGNQFEQRLNARYLEHEGYGCGAESLEDVAAVRTFFDRLPAYEERLAGFTHDRNESLLAAIDRLIPRRAKPSA
jgi:uncharacterized protein (TIGR00661 family)